MEADRRLAELVTDQYGVFATAHVRALGFGGSTIARRIGAGDWRVLHRGVYRLAGVAATWRGDLLAACWAGGFRAAASHRSAAALWGLPGGRRHVVEIVCPRWRRAQHPGLIVHESSAYDERDLTVVDGVPVTIPELTLLGDRGGVLHRRSSRSRSTRLRIVGWSPGVRWRRRWRASPRGVAAGIAPHARARRTTRLHQRTPGERPGDLAPAGTPPTRPPEPVMQFEVRTEANEFVAGSTWRTPRQGSRSSTTATSSTAVGSRWCATANVGAGSSPPAGCPSPRPTRRSRRAVPRLPPRLPAHSDELREPPALVRQEPPSDAMEVTQDAGLVGE